MVSFREGKDRRRDGSKASGPGRAREKRKATARGARDWGRLGVRVHWISSKV